VGEVAVMKTLGFQDGALFGIVLAEALTICLVGGAVGLVLARVTVGSAREIQSMIPGFAIDARTILFGAALAVLLGTLTGLVPALQASRLSVVDALRRVE
jgi:putative ABC transport system permease protein